MAKKSRSSAPSGPVKISYSSLGKDFHLEVRGGRLDDCEKAFERLYKKVKGTKGGSDNDSHYG